MRLPSLRLVVLVPIAFASVACGGSDFSNPGATATGGAAGAAGANAGGSSAMGAKGGTANGGEAGASRGGNAGTGGSNGATGGAAGGGGGQGGKGGAQGGSSGGTTGGSAGIGGAQGGSAGAQGGKAGAQGGSAGAQGGNGGAQGGSAGAQGGSGTCSNNQPPVAMASGPSVVNAGDPFTLDASKSSDPDGTSLSFAWQALDPNAPQVGMPAAALPMLTATTCGTFAYQVTVTDACMATSTAKVQVMILANGPYVSSATCNPQLQCGTVQNPWCTVQAGVNGTATSPVKVAAAKLPYVEDVQMKNGIDVNGGYETTFTLAPDPVKNVTEIDVKSHSGIYWGDGVTATLEGVKVVMVDPNPGVTLAERGAITGSGASNVTIVDTVVGALLSSGNKPDQGYGIWMQAGTGGSLTVSGTTNVSAPDTNDVSAALFVDPAFDGKVKVSVAATFTGGASGNESYGALDHGTGSFTVDGATFTGGTAKTRSVGVYLDGATMVATLSRATMTGGDALSSVGIYGEMINALSLIGGNVATATGSAGASAFGLRADSVAKLSISNGGGNVPNDVYSGPAAGSACAIGVGASLTGSASASPQATITQATFDGGTGCAVHRGLDVDSVAATVSKITATGSTKGSPYEAVGVSFTGTFASGAMPSLTGSTAIGGAATEFVPMTGNPTPYLAAGVYVNATAPVTLDGNALLKGCEPACAGSGVNASALSVGAGVYVIGGTGHVISNNAEIRGGPHLTNAADPKDNQNVAHGGIFATGTPNSGTVGVTVTNNGLVVGHTEGAGSTPARPQSVYGIASSNATIAVTSNKRIFGGYGVQNAFGVYVFPVPFGTNNAVITGNEIDGGTALATAGVHLDSLSPVSGNASVVRDNVIQACGIVPSSPGGPAAECLGGTSTGLYVFNAPLTLISNNYVFGGFGSNATGCDVGNDGQTKDPTWLVYDLCASQGRAGTVGTTTSVGLRFRAGVGGKAPTHIYVIDTLITAGVDAAIRFPVQEQGANVDKSSIFVNNDLFPDPFGNGTGVVWQRSDGATLTIIGVNSVVNNSADNVSVDPSFIMPTPFAPTAAGYHIGGGSPVRHAGEAITPIESFDFDGDPRGTGTGSSAPAIGPDEPG